MGRHSGVPYARARDVRAWLRSRGPVTLAAALLLEVSSATTPNGPHARALVRAALLGLILFAVLLAAAIDGLLSRLVAEILSLASSLQAWSRVHVLGYALPAPVPDEQLRDRGGRPLRGGSRSARIAAIQRERARLARARSLRGRTERVLALLSRRSAPLTRRLAVAGLAVERRVLAVRAVALAGVGAASRRARPYLARLAYLARARALALRDRAAPRISTAGNALRARLAQERAVFPARTAAAARAARAGLNAAGRAASAVPVPAIAVPAPSLRTLRVVTAALMLSFVFATVVGTTGLVASRGSVALGASTTLAIIAGEALVSDAGATELRVAADGEVLTAGATIKTGPDTYAILTYFEGSTVSIDPNTVLVIESLHANPDGSTIIGMRQDVGQTWHAVTKLLTNGSKYEVRTPTATATVRGTMFLVGVVPGSAPDILETVIETTEGAVAAEREPTPDAPEGEEVVVPAGFRVRAAPEAPIPPPIPAPEPERKITVTVGAPNSLVVDPQGRANGEKDGKIIVQTPGAKVEKVDGQIVVTLPNTSDGKISTVIAPPDDEETAPAPVQVVTVVQERGRGESRSEETIQPSTTAPVVTGVEVKKGDGPAAPEVRRLDESERERPEVKVGEVPAPPVAAAGGQGQPGAPAGAPPAAGGERSASPMSVANSIVTLTLPPLSKEEVARREAQQREQEERDRRERERRDEERRQEEERRIAELRRAEEQARAEAQRTEREREQEEQRRREASSARREEPAPSPAGVIEQIFRAVGQRDDGGRAEDLRRAEEDARRKAEQATEERREAERRQREEAIRVEEEKRREADRRADELRRQEERAKQEEARKLQELRRIAEKAREQAQQLEVEQRREAERRLQEFREAEERKRGEQARALEEQRRAEERARGEAERRLEQLRREQEEARERERERERERARERERERERDRERQRFVPTETLKPLPGVGTRSVEQEEQRGKQLQDRSERRESAREQRDDDRSERGGDDDRRERGDDRREGERDRDGEGQERRDGDRQERGDQYRRGEG